MKICRILFVFLLLVAGVHAETENTKPFPIRISTMFHVEKTTQEIMYPGYVMGEDQFDEGTSQNVTVFKMILNLSSATNKQDKQHLEEAIKTGKLELLIWKDKELVVKTFILNDSNSSEKAEYNFSINGGRSYKGNIYFFYMYNGAQVAQPIMNYN